jgi:hypothetical protein
LLLLLQLEMTDVGMPKAPARREHT